MMHGKIPVVLFQNEHFVLVDKPCNWLSVPSRLGESDPRPCVGRWLETFLGVRVFPVHRLDEPVSGLLLFALNAPAHRTANAWFEKGLVRKCYDAWSEMPRIDAHVGGPAFGGVQHENLPEVGKKVEWRVNLAKGKKRAFVNDAYGKPCLTEALFLETLQGSSCLYAHWHLWPVTGRSHQLRFELYRHGCPLLGDLLYGSAKPWSAGIALRVFEIDFENCKDAPSFGLPRCFDTEGLDRPS